LTQSHSKRKLYKLSNLVTSMAKTIKISIDNYKWLSRIAANLQHEREKPVSLDEALTRIKMKRDKKDILSYAGIWEGRDVESVRKGIKNGWSSWKIRSV